MRAALPQTMPELAKYGTKMPSISTEDLNVLFNGLRKHLASPREPKTSTPESLQLTDFFCKLRDSSSSPAAPLKSALNPARLYGFFEALSSVPRNREVLEKQKDTIEVDHSALTTFFNDLRQPLERERAMGAFCNPWRVAKLNRDEVRNTAVLAWLLDPAGDHGLGNILLSGLLTRINRSQNQIPSESIGRVDVTPEAWLSEGINRVDIEIFSKNPSAPFYLLLEAKIDASEGVEQLPRYLRAARLAAEPNDLPWAIVFLTVNGRASRTAAGIDTRQICNLSWSELARVLIRALDLIPRTHPACQGFGQRLAETFLRHVRDF